MRVIKDLRIPLVPERGGDVYTLSGGIRVLRFRGRGGSSLCYDGLDERGQGIVIKELFPMELCNTVYTRPEPGQPVRFVPGIESDRCRIEKRRLENRVKRELKVSREVTGTVGAYSFQSWELEQFGDTRYIGMCTTAGRCLSEQLRDEGTLKVCNAIRRLKQMMVTVEHIHRSGYIHCDLKPENFYCSGEGDNTQMKILDFGSAVEADWGRLDMEELVDSGVGSLSPSYASRRVRRAAEMMFYLRRKPESLQRMDEAKKALGELSFGDDSYSLMKIFFRMITGTDFAEDKWNPNELAERLDLPESEADYLIRLMQRACRAEFEDLSPEGELYDCLNVLEEIHCQNGVHPQLLLETSRRKQMDFWGKVDPDIFAPIKCADSGENFENLYELFVMQRSGSKGVEGIVLTGDGGCGKSTQMIDCWGQLLEEKAGEKRGVLPIFIPLYELDRDTPHSDCILRYICREYAGTRNGRNDYLENLLDLLTADNSAYEYVFLLDGLNEAEDVKAVTREIIKCSRMKNVHVILTTRAIDKNNHFFNGFVNAHLEQLDQKQMEKYLGADYAGVANTQTEREWLNNPMMLVIYKEMADKWEAGSGKLGEVCSQGELLNLYFDQYLEEVSGKLLGREKGEMVSFALHRFLPLLAWRMRDEEKARYTIPKKALVGVLRDVYTMCGRAMNSDLLEMCGDDAVLKKYRSPDGGPDLPFMVQDLLKGILCETLGILRQDGKKIWFGHQLVQDYFLAKALPLISIVDGQEGLKLVRLITDGIRYPGLPDSLELERRKGYFPTAVFICDLYSAEYEDFFDELAGEGPGSAQRAWIDFFTQVTAMYDDLSRREEAVLPIWLAVDLLQAYCKRELSPQEIMFCAVSYNMIFYTVLHIYDEQQLKFQADRARRLFKTADKETPKLVRTNAEVNEYAAKLLKRLECCLEYCRGVDGYQNLSNKFASNYGAYFYRLKQYDQALEYHTGTLQARMKNLWRADSREERRKCLLNIAISLETIGSDYYFMGGNASGTDEKIIYYQRAKTSFDRAFHIRKNWAEKNRPWNMMMGINRIRCMGSEIRLLQLRRPPDPEAARDCMERMISVMNVVKDKEDELKNICEHLCSLLVYNCRIAKPGKVERETAACILEYYRHFRYQTQSRFADRMRKQWGGSEPDREAFNKAFSGIFQIEDAACLKELWREDENACD